MRLPSLLLALSLTAVASSADNPQVRLPSGPQIQQPLSPPDAAVKLAKSQFYIVDSDVPCLILSSPSGKVTITEMSGPITFRGYFVDSLGVETRTYKGKFVYSVEAASTGTTELLVIPDGTKNASQVIRRTLEVDAGKAPQPPPLPVDPKVDPKPVDPKVDPVNPFPGDKLRVLVIYDSKTLPKLPPEQHSVLFSAKVREYLNANCPVGPDGKTHDWRMWPDDTDPKLEAAIWQNAMKLERKSLPWIIVSDGKRLYSDVLPKNVDEMMGLLKKYTP